MEQRHTPWRDRLPSEWFGYGLEILREHEIEEGHYQNKTIKERLLDSMAVPNIMALVESARSMGGTDEAVKRLGLHRGTPNRWEKNEAQPHARLFFGLLTLGLRKEIDEVNLPRNREVLWKAVSRTVAIIRQKECGRDYRCPSPEQWACVWWLMRHPWADELSPGSSRPADPSRVREVIEAIAYETRKRFPGGELRTPRLVQHAIDDWAEPYVLFRIGLLSGWEFLDDIAI